MTENNDQENNKQTSPGPDMPDGMSSIDRMPITIHAQYIKDLSFENPNAPMPLRKSDGKSQINVDFSMDAQEVELEGLENTYEVTLFVNVHARKGDITSFLIELEYAMALSVHDVPEDKIHPLLLIEMPHYLFPFGRQIVSDLTQSAGFMPFMLAPVNFKALYRKRFGGPQVSAPEKQEKEEKETA
jgi:preprotein translocase subunit SecB